MWGEVWRKPGVSLGGLPQGSHTEHCCFISPAMSCDNTCEMSTKEAHQRCNVQDSYWGLVQ